MEQSYTFSINISYVDETGTWSDVWNKMKDQLTLNFASIRYKDYSNSLRSLSSFNLKMSSTAEFPLFSLYIVKINSHSELKKEVKEKLNSNFLKFKTSLLVVLMDIDNNENGVKTALKAFDKIKAEFKVHDLRLLPVNPAQGKLNDIIADFFRDFKFRVSTEINEKLSFYSQQVENYKSNKIDSRTTMFNYINCKDNLISYLQLTDFNEEIQKLCEEDLMKDLEKLPRTSSYSEPFSFLDFNESLIRKKISEHTLSNLEYQQYLMYQLIKSCKQLRDYKKLNVLFMKILSNLHVFKDHFYSKYHFTFWCYQLTFRFNTFFKSLKSNSYSNFDEDINIRGQINVLYIMKKILKQFTLLIKQEIPNLALFSLYLRNNITSQSELIDYFKQKMNPSTFIEDPMYEGFIKDVQDNYDEKSIHLITNRVKILEEYLTILTSIEKLHSQLHQNNLLIRVQLEKLPIMLFLAKFPNVRSTLVAVLKLVEKEKWGYIVDFIKYLLVLYISITTKSEENLKLMITMMKMKFSCLDQLNSYFKIEDRLSIYKLISDYIASYSEIKTKVEFIANDLLRFNLLYLNNRNDSVINVNVNREKESTFLLEVENLSTLEYSIANVVFIFEDELNKRDVIFPYIHEEIKFIPINAKIGHNLIIPFANEDLFQSNSMIHIKEIKLILQNGIEGVYTFTTNQLKINLKNTNFEIKSTINNDHDMYYNTLYTMRLDLQSLNDISRTGTSFSISLDEVRNEEEGIKPSFTSPVRIACYQMEDIKGTPCQYKSKTHMNTITYNDVFDEDYYILQIQFIMIDTDYYRSHLRNLEVKVEVNSSEKNIFLFKEFHSLMFQHIFSLSYKTKLSPTNDVLVQCSLGSNQQIDQVKLHLDHEISMNMSRSYNLVFTLPKGVNIPFKEIEQNKVSYSIKGKPFLFYHPETVLLQHLDKMTLHPFYIQIRAKGELVQLFKEMQLNITIRKYLRDEVLMMIRIKDSDNWTVVGKSKIIEKLPSVEDGSFIEVKTDITLIPLQDGYVKTPEIDFMEFKTNNLSYEEMKNINCLEFLPLSSGSIVEGNEKVLKVNTIHNCALRLNLI